MKLTRIAICIMMLGAATAANAQVDAFSGATQQVRQRVKSSTANVDKIAKAETARLRKALSLTSEQTKKVQAIVKKYSSLKPTTTNIKKMDSEIEKLLDDGQKKKYSAYKNNLSALRRFSVK